MNIIYIKESFHSDKKDRDFYLIRVAVKFADGSIKKGEPVVWLTKEEFDKLSTNN